MKKTIKAIIAIGLIAAAFAFAPNVKISIEQPTAAACDAMTGIGCG